MSATKKRSALTEPKSDPQGLHRSVFVMDNIHALRAMNSDSVDLIYLDPPFNKNKEYSAPIGSEAAGAAFKDAWTLSDVDLVDHNRLKRENPALYWLIYSVGETHSKEMFSYLMMMAPRIVELARILRPTGSIWLHCDPTASHYLKLLMDSIFGHQYLRNEIIWCYPPKGRGPKRAFHRKHDVLLFYAASNEQVFRRPYTALNEYQQRKFSQVDEDGRRYKEFKGRRTYLDESKGRPVPSWWTDIAQTGQSRTEYIGYPTQKPLALLDRIIKTSSNEGDLVLDPFCGCATTMVAAELLGRKWVGIDLSDLASELVVRRIKRRQNLFSFKDISQRESPPIRTDIERRMIKRGKEWNAHKGKLFNDQEGLCNICRRDFPVHMFEIDHIMPTSKGGQDWEDNLQLLCTPCNRTKGNGTQEAARDRVFAAGRMNMDAFNRRDSGHSYAPPILPKAAEPIAPYGRKA